MNRTITILAIMMLAVGTIRVQAATSPQPAVANSDQDQQQIVERKTVKIKDAKLREETRQAEQQMREARRKLEEAARRLAELSAKGMDEDFALSLRMNGIGHNRGRLGIILGRTDKASRGVLIEAVTPGGPADKAGLQAGDLITAINGKQLAGKSSDAGIHALMHAMHSVKPGDKVKLVYQRSGKSNTVKLTAAPFMMREFAMWKGDHDAPLLRGYHGMPFFFGFTRRWGDMRLAELSPDLGSYFGTTKGVLVLRAPHEGGLQLKAGDVITRIGDRLPGSPRHAMRIIQSYGPGETLKLEILRHGKAKTLSVKIPQTPTQSSRVKIPYPRIRVETRSAAI